MRRSFGQHPPRTSFSLFLFLNAFQRFAFVRRPFTGSVLSSSLETAYPLRPSRSHLRHPLSLISTPLPAEISRSRKESGNVAPPSVKIPGQVEKVK